VRAVDVQRVPAREQAVDLEAPGQRQHVGEHPGLDLRDVHRLLLLEDARLHAVVADAVSRPRGHGVVDAHQRQRGHGVAVLAHQVHLADLLLERAAHQLDAQRVGLERPGLVVAQALGARVLVAIVAVEAVVDLALDLALVHASVGEDEALAVAALVVRTHEELRQRRVGAAQLHQVHVVDGRRRVQRRPAPGAVVVVAATRGEPGLDGIEGEGGQGPVLGRGRRRAGHRRGGLGHRRDLRVVEQRGAHPVGPRRQLVGPGGAAGLLHLAGGVVDLEEQHGGPRHRVLLGVRAALQCVGGRAHGHQRAARGAGGELGRGRPGLAGGGLEEALLGELLLEEPERVAAMGRLDQLLRLGGDAEELDDEARDPRRGGEQGLGDGLGLHPHPAAGAVGVEARVRSGVALLEPALEGAAQVGEALGREEVGVGEAGQAEHQRGGVTGGRGPGGEVDLQAVAAASAVG
jgi:hypothetical protein